MVDYLLIAIIAAAMFAAVRKFVKDTAAGGCPSCSGCSRSKGCPQQLK